jgi:hypothetical protein
MFPKLVTLTVVLMCLMATLLVLRQQRLELANQTARLHSKLIRERHDIWDAQSRAALVLTPSSLQRRIDDARLALAPVVPQGPGPAYAEAQQHNVQQTRQRVR